MILTLTRIAQSADGTFGTLTDESNNRLCMTGEPAPDIEHPCIPSGTYHCIPHNSQAHPNTWELENVPGRISILIHNGNSPKESSLGCILVGDNYGTIDGLPAVVGSRDALDKLRKTLPPEFDILIQEQFD